LASAKFKGNDFMNNIPNAVINVLDTWFVGVDGYLLSGGKVEYKNCAEFRAIDKLRKEIEALRAQTRDHRAHTPGDANSAAFGKLNNEVVAAVTKLRKEMHRQPAGQKVYFIQNNESRLKMQKLLNQKIIFDQDVKKELAKSRKDMDKMQTQMFKKAETMVNLAINLIRAKNWKMEL